MISITFASHSPVAASVPARAIVRGASVTFLPERFRSGWRAERVRDVVYSGLNRERAVPASSRWFWKERESAVPDRSSSETPASSFQAFWSTVRVPAIEEPVGPMDREKETSPVTLGRKAASSRGTLSPADSRSDREMAISMLPRRAVSTHSLIVISLTGGASPGPGSAGDADTRRRKAGKKKGIFIALFSRFSPPIVYHVIPVNMGTRESVPVGGTP